MSQTSFTAPAVDSKKIENVELIHPGQQVCTLYSMIDVGTQDTNFGPKRQVKLAFEFPQHMRVFYEGDDPKPAAVFVTETLSMGDKANLRKKWVQPMINRVFQDDDEAAAFDIGTLLGKHFVVTIVHSADGKWANIMSIQPLDERNMVMFGLQQPTINRINEISFFHLSQGFDSEAFGKLSNKMRNLLMTSPEGVEFKSKGGKFRDKIERQNNSSGSSSGSGNPKLQMIGDYTYDQLKQSDYSDQQMVDAGYAKWVQATPPPPPVQQTPPPPAGKKVLVFKDANAAPLADWIRDGWTEEDIVAGGHATWQTSGAPTPPPPVKKGPPAPPAQSANSPHDDDDVPF